MKLKVDGDTVDIKFVDDPECPGCGEFMESFEGYQEENKEDLRFFRVDFPWDRVAWVCEECQFAQFHDRQMIRF